MFSWTNLVAGRAEYYNSPISSAKIYVVDRNNPLATDIFVKQVPCADEAHASKVLGCGRISQTYLHPNICECLTVVIEANPAGGKFVYIITRFQPSDLSKEIKKRVSSLQEHFPEDYMKQLLSKLVSAYAFLQDSKVTYRDIKPESILLDENGDPKVCDFGCAKEGFTTITESTFLGSVMYFSPLLRCAVISGTKLYSKVAHNPFKSDVYSLGMTLLHASCLELPSTLGQTQKLQENINERVNGIAYYSEAWKAILKRMLTVEESARPDFLQLRREIDPSFVPLSRLPFPVFPFTDDEAIIISADIIAEAGDPLEVSAVCGYSQIPVAEYRFETVPCMITLKVSESMAQRNQGMDLVCVIDCSYSMVDERMGPLQATLRGLLSQLNHLDRVSLVVFNGQAERRCPLTICTKSGKQRILGEIDRLKGSGTTNLAFGFVCGLEVLKQRRIKNSLSAMLLFSDGESNEGPDALSTSIQALQTSGIQHEMFVYTFGFGNEIDTHLLLSLANTGRGSFQSVCDESSTKAAFSYILGSAKSVGVKDVAVSLRLNAGPVQIDVVKKFTRDGADFFSIPEIAGGSRKDLLFSIRPEYQAITTQHTFPPVTAEVRYTFGGKELGQDVPLIMKFGPWEQGKGDVNRDVFENWNRVKGADALREAKEHADNKNFQKAVMRLSNAREDIGSSGYETASTVAAVLRDLEAAEKLVHDNTSWVREAGGAKFASVCYSHYTQSASPAAPQYASAEQVRVANRMVAGEMSQIDEESI